MNSARPWNPAAWAGGQPEAVLAFDIETTFEKHLAPDDWGDRFPKPMWHRVRAISMVEARIDRSEDGSELWVVEVVRSGGREDWDERRLLAGFWAHLGSRPLRWLTWNGAKFDVVVLLARSFLLGLDAGIVWRRGTKFSNYLSRFDPTWHLDVMQALSLNGMSQPHGLDETARALGWPGKGDEHGSLVADMVARGELRRVRAYCETDAVHTFASALSWMRLCGSMGSVAHDRSIDSLMEILAADPVASPHLAALARHRLDGEKNAARQDAPFAANSGQDSQGLSFEQSKPLQRA